MGYLGLDQSGRRTKGQLLYVITALAYHALPGDVAVVDVLWISQSRVLLLFMSVAGGASSYFAYLLETLQFASCDVTGKICMPWFISVD